VNQGDTFEDEFACGCIFASAAGDGYPDYKHHRNILELRREDALFHYHDRRIVAVSRVTGVELNKKRPYERKG